MKGGLWDRDLGSRRVLIRILYFGIRTIGISRLWKILYSHIINMGRDSEYSLIPIEIKKIPKFIQYNNLYLYIFLLNTASLIEIF